MNVDHDDTLPIVAAITGHASKRAAQVDHAPRASARRSCVRRQRLLDLSPFHEVRPCRCPLNAKGLRGGNLRTLCEIQR